MPALMAVKKIVGQTLSSEKFEKIIEKLFSEGFVNTNGAVTQLANYMDYKAWLQIEEFEDNNGHKITLEFIKEFVGGRIYYHIKEVALE